MPGTEGYRVLLLDTGHLAAGMSDADPTGTVGFLHPPAGLAAFRDTRLSPAAKPP